MANDLVVNSSTNVLKRNELAELSEKLKKSGYHKKVLTPEAYLKTLRQDTVTTDEGADLELTEAPVSNAISESRTGKQPAALNHWNKKVKARFDECTSEQKKAWLDSFKIIEKSYVKQLNEMKEDLLLAEPVFELLMPHQDYFIQSGKTPTEYFKMLMDFDKELGADPAKAVAKLVVKWNLSKEAIAQAMNEAIADIEHEEREAKTLAPLKKEINKLKTALGVAGSQEVDYQQADNMADDVARKIEAFFDQRDKQGQLLYPKAYDYIDDIIELYQTGMDLDTAYNNVVEQGTPAPAQENGVSAEYYDEAPQMPKGQDAEREYLMRTFNKIKRGY
jgi:phage host-nuclease inhibitor protein Gam